MPSNNTAKPSMISIDSKLRLVSYQGQNSFALEWYQDLQLVKMVDNREKPYDMELLECMYTYLNQHGELYFIEVCMDGEWKKAGDVTLGGDGDLPIVIAPAYQKQGIGNKVIQTLIIRAKSLGMEKLEVRIYQFNEPSQKLFTRNGFVKTRETETEYIYTLQLL